MRTKRMVVFARTSFWNFLILICSVSFGDGNVVAQEVVTDEVSITTVQHHIFAITPGEGIARKPLAAGEKIIETEAKGVTGFVHTSTRLLGFSGEQQRWVEIRVAASEHILVKTVSPRMVIVQGEDSVYGFISGQARWRREAWGAGETVLDYAIEDHVVVFLTNRRAVAFSAITGGFFSEDLPVGDRIRKIQINDNVVIVHLSDRKLVFRSRLAVWTELR